MKIEDCFKLGKITRLYGTKGELALVLDVDDPDDYINLDFFYTDIHGELIPYFIEKPIVKSGKSFAIKLIDIDEPKAAGALINRLIYLPLDRLPKLDEDQFYFHEIIGYTVIDDTLGETGIIKDILEFPMQELLQIDHNGKEILLPISDELIMDIDKEKKILYISAPEGLIELYLE